MSVRVSKLLILCALTGCASPRCPDIPGGPRYCLQPSTAVAPFTALQDIRIRRGDLDERLIAQLEVDTAGMRLAGLTPLGQKVLSAEFDNDQARGVSLAGDRFDPRALLSLVQIATWPADSVAAGLDDGWEIAHDGAARRLLHGDELIMEVLREGTPPRYDRLDIHMPKASLYLNVQEVKDAE